MSSNNFEIREQTKRTKLFYRGRYVAAFNDCMWRPYIYPLCTPQGICPIHEASVDHPFHNGIFFGHRRVAAEDGRVVDFWIPVYSPTSVAASGRIICRERTWLARSENRIEFRERDEWQDAMSVPWIEQRTAYEFECGKACNALCVHARLTALQKLVFLQTKEALLAVRIADTFCVHNGGRIVDANGGVNEAGIMEKTSAWVDCQGRIASLTAGIAIRQPSNRAPIPWFARDYGLIGINQFRNGPELTLNVGETYALDVLIVAHDDDHTNAEVQQLLTS